jgi:hypothetical protein
MHDLGEVIVEVRRLHAKCKQFEESNEYLIQTIQKKDTQMEQMDTGIGRLEGKVDNLILLFKDKVQKLRMPQNSSAFPQSVIRILEQLESGLSAIKTIR